MIMKITDRVYGSISISDPLIQDLINSSPMQRLKGVDQSGATRFLEPKRNITRYEHSIGVWHILHKFGAKIRDQVAGLLHDVPHTAFSHVIDVVFPTKEHKYHEQFLEKIILNSEIPKIFKNHGVKIEEILAKEKFPLLEIDLLDLSADRIDYFLRDTRTDKLFPDFLVNKFLDNLFVKDEAFYFKDQSLAALYSILFINAGRLLWLNPDSHGSFSLLANVIKRAMEINQLKEDDLFLTDVEVTKKLRKISDKIVQKNLKRLSPTTHFVYCDKSEAEFTRPNKPRVVDPWVISSGRKARISELIPKLKEFFDDYKSAYNLISVKQIT